MDRLRWNQLGLFLILGLTVVALGACATMKPGPKATLKITPDKAVLTPQLLKEPIARRANREDDCTGHFWEGRFKSIRLLDRAAILACMVYVDLNPLRAKIVQTLHDCAFTSLLQRLKVLRRETSDKRPTTARRHAKSKVPLLSVEALFPLTTGEYVSLVASTGGVPIDQRDHRPTLASFGIDPEAWVNSIRSTIQWIGTAVGNTAELLHEAARRKTDHVVNPLRIYRR